MREQRKRAGSLEEGMEVEGDKQARRRPGVSDLNVPMGSKVDWEDLSAGTGMGEEAELGGTICLETDLRGGRTLSSRRGR